MKPQFSQSQPVFRSRLSFRPLLGKWKETISNGPAGASRLYQHLLDEVNKFPELSEPLDSYGLLEEHKELIDEMMATVFPVSVNGREEMFSVMVPFSGKIIFASELFRKEFLNEKGEIRKVQFSQLPDKIQEERIQLAYKLILSEFYGIRIEGAVKSIYKDINPETGLESYLEMQLDPGLTEVFIEEDLPDLPDEIYLNFHSVDDLQHYPELAEVLPLDKFRFEGIMIVSYKNVTEKESINQIRLALRAINTAPDDKCLDSIEQEFGNLLERKDIHIGITPLFTINGHFVFTDWHHSPGIIMRDIAENERKTDVSRRILEFFSKEEDNFKTLDDIYQDTKEISSFFRLLVKKEYGSGFVIPLKGINKKPIGLLEIFSENKLVLNKASFNRVLPAILELEKSLQRASDSIEGQINKVIREQFTAVQESVEWKFTDVAIKYLSRLSKGEEAKVEPIVFENVFPLYGAVDIRNSSVERNIAIQQDIIDQLNRVKNIVLKAQEFTSYPVLKEIELRIDRYLESVNDFLFSNDEQLIQIFLKDEATGLLRHLDEIVPSLKKDIENYNETIDKSLHLFYKNRSDFENSVTQINTHIARFIDREQHDAQQIYPHYFERFVTDGVEFNMYAGQSITPEKKFDLFYLKNLRLWQLTILAKTAQLAHRIKQQLPLPLQTTQLLLAYYEPIAIRFRTEERKFDVDGVYNVRYEILKKRIDKVRIRHTNERLTQPGTVAVVYSHANEAEEYLQYFEFLKSRNLLTGEAEKYDLEELQGISGLKALRMAVAVENIEDYTSKSEFQGKEIDR